MPHEVLEATQVCPECGATCPVGQVSCWLCHGSLTRNAPTAEVIDAELVRPPAFVFSEVVALVVIILIALVIGLIAIGLAVDEPSSLIGLAIVVVPAFLATAVRVHAQRQRKGSVTWLERLLTFIVSTAIVVGILGLLGAALMVAFIIYCFVALAGGSVP